MNSIDAVTLAGRRSAAERALAKGCDMFPVKIKELLALIDAAEAGAKAPQGFDEWVKSLPDYTDEWPTIRVAHAAWDAGWSAGWSAKQPAPPTGG